MWPDDIRQGKRVTPLEFENSELIGICSFGGRGSANFNRPLEISGSEMRQNYKHFSTCCSECLTIL